MAEESTITFKDIQEEVPTARGRGGDFRNLSKVQEFQIGNGNAVWRADKRGMWLGAKRWEDAPFRVNMNGDIVSITLSSETVTARRVQTADTGQRVVIDDVSNTIRFYNSANALILELQGLTAFTENSQIKIAGGMSGSSANNANYNAGYRLWNAGFGATGIIAILEAFNLETASVRARLGVRTDGELWWYGTGTSPVFVVKNDGTIECEGIWAVLPTSTAGQPSGALWNDSGTVKVVP